MNAWLLGVTAMFLLAGAAWAATGSGLEEPQGLQWWERGQSDWPYKDDWQAKFLIAGQPYTKSYELPARPTRAAVYVWSAGQYRLFVNDRLIGEDRDNGTIEDYDITSALAAGANTIRVEGGGEVIVEGVAILPDGRELHIRSDETWNNGTVKTSDRRRGGPSGYGGDTHNGRVMALSAEQKAKVIVNDINSARRRILDRERFLVWRARDPREVLSLGQPTSVRQTWARIEQLIADARPAVEAATQLIKAGRFDEVAAAAAPAVKNTAEADRLVQQLFQELRGRAGQRAGEVWIPAAGGHSSFNESMYNRLGWVASAEPLDNDPTFWEFDIAPAGAQSLGLAGVWQFQVDPDDSGVARGLANGGAGWGTIYAPSKLGWERHGITQDNYNVKGRSNKQYNGYAWYRQSITIPASWAGSDLVLYPGVIGNNSHWVAVNGTFLTPPAQDGSREDTVTIPAALVRFGQPNTLAIRIFNNDNFGGITNPRFRISRAGGVPDNRKSILGMGIAREITYPTADGQITQVTVSSAMSPGVIVGTSGRSIDLRGWAARGYTAPTHMASAAIAAGPMKDGAIGDPGGNWLLLYSPSAAPDAPRPVLVVLEKRPTSIAFGDDGMGGKALQLRFAQNGARIGLVRPLDAIGAVPTAAQFERCRLWAAAMLAYPIGLGERVAFEGNTCSVQMAYEYLELKDDWGTQPVKLAPLPMLFSYALEHRWPDARAQGNVVNLGCRARSGYYPQSDCGEYRAIVGADRIAYAFDRMEPAIHLRGAGTLGEELRGPEMYDNFVKWGFNSCRPQIQFHGGRGWASFMKNPEGGRQGRWDENSVIAFGGRALEQLDQVIAWHRQRNLVFIPNWFWNYDRAENEPNKAIVNSSRYWKFAPAVRQHVIDMWVEIARHCKDLPEGAIIYDFVNEPSDVYWDDYNRFIKDIRAAIRKVDTVHWIAQEAGGGWAQVEDLDMTDHDGDSKSIFEFHFYGPHTGDCHRYDLWFPRYELHMDRIWSAEQLEERMLPAIRFGIRHHCQMFHGEFGTSFIGPDLSPEKWTESLLALHHKYRIHWSWWNYAGDNINRTGLMAGQRVNPLVATLSKYARMAPPK